MEDNIVINDENNPWVEICRIDDEDSRILVFRKILTNDFILEIYDIDPISREYIFRDKFISNGDIKYASMTGFAPLDCPECLEGEEVVLEHTWKLPE